MPWTRKQVKYLLLSGSPLTAGQKDKMKGELHANPAMGHEKKGSAELKKREEISKFKGESHDYSHKRPKRKVVSRYAR